MAAEEVLIQEAAQRLLPREELVPHELGKVGLQPDTEQEPVQLDSEPDVESIPKTQLECSTKLDLEPQRDPEPQQSNLGQAPAGLASLRSTPVALWTEKQVVQWARALDVSWAAQLAAALEYNQVDGDELAATSADQLERMLHHAGMLEDDTTVAVATVLKERAEAVESGPAVPKSALRVAYLSTSFREQVLRDHAAAEPANASAVAAINARGLNIAENQTWWLAALERGRSSPVACAQKGIVGDVQSRCHDLITPRVTLLPKPPSFVAKQETTKPRPGNASAKLIHSRVPPDHRSPSTSRRRLRPVRSTVTAKGEPVCKAMHGLGRAVQIRKHESGSRPDSSRVLFSEDQRVAPASRERNRKTFAAAPGRPPWQHASLEQARPYQRQRCLHRMVDLKQKKKGSQKSDCDHNRNCWWLRAIDSPSHQSVGGVSSTGQGTTTKDKLQKEEASSAQPCIAVLSDVATIPVDTESKANADTKLKPQLGREYSKAETETEAEVEPTPPAVRSERFEPVGWLVHYPSKPKSGAEHVPNTLQSSIGTHVSPYSTEDAAAATDMEKQRLTVRQSDIYLGSNMQTLQHKKGLAIPIPTLQNANPDAIQGRQKPTAKPIVESTASRLTPPKPAKALKKSLWRLAALQHESDAPASMRKGRGKSTIAAVRSAGRAEVAAMERTSGPRQLLATRGNKKTTGSLQSEQRSQTGSRLQIVNARMPSKPHKPLHLSSQQRKRKGQRQTRLREKQIQGLAHSMPCTGQDLKMPATTKPSQHTAGPQLSQPREQDRNAEGRRETEPKCKQTVHRGAAATCMPEGSVAATPVNRLGLVLPANDDDTGWTEFVKAVAEQEAKAAEALLLQIVDRIEGHTPPSVTLTQNQDNHNRQRKNTSPKYGRSEEDEGRSQSPLIVRAPAGEDRRNKTHDVRHHKGQNPQHHHVKTSPHDVGKRKAVQAEKAAAKKRILRILAQEKKRRRATRGWDEQRQSANNHDLQAKFRDQTQTVYHTPSDTGLRMVQHKDVCAFVVSIIQYWMQWCEKFTTVAWQRNQRVGAWGRFGRGQLCNQFDSLAARLHSSLTIAESAVFDPPQISEENNQGSLLPPAISHCIGVAWEIIGTAIGTTDIDDAVVLLQSTFATAGASTSLGTWSQDKSELSWAEEQLIDLLLRRLHAAITEGDVKWSEKLLLHALGRMNGEAREPATQEEQFFDPGPDNCRHSSSTRTALRGGEAVGHPGDVRAGQWKATMNLLETFARETEVQVTMSLDLAKPDQPLDRKFGRQQLRQIQQEIATVLGVDVQQVEIDEMWDAS